MTYTTTSLFPKNHLMKNGFIGFDVFDDLFKGLETSNNFPPANIYKNDKYNYVVELAVAGYSQEDLTVTLENNFLTISGERTNKTDNETLVYQGIASRSFTRQFGIPENAYVEDASLKNGMLRINIKLREPEKDTQTVKINSLD